MLDAEGARTIQGLALWKSSAEFANLRESESRLDYVGMCVLGGNWHQESFPAAPPPLSGASRRLWDGLERMLNRRIFEAAAIGLNAVWGVSVCFPTEWSDATIDEFLVFAHWFLNRLGYRTMGRFCLDCADIAVWWNAPFPGEEDGFR